MQDIKQLRNRIDAVDDQILLLLCERVAICRDIGSAKKDLKLPVKDSTREKEVHEQIKEKASRLSLDPDQVEVVYREIVNMCSAVQE
jgi:chorismate mutase